MPFMCSLEKLTRYGLDGSIVFLQSCLDKLNLCEGDAHNMQLKLKLLSIVVKYLMHRPNFNIVFWEAVKNTHTGESILADFSKT